MIKESEILTEVDKLNSVAKKLSKNYEYRKGNDGTFGLFEVHDSNVYRPVYMSKTSSGFFAYVNLLKNLYEKGKITE